MPLTEARQIPVGSFLDTKRGTVELVSATGSGSKTQSGKFNAGLFQVLQSRNRSAKGLTELRLKGSSFNRCRARGGSAAKREANAAAALAPHDPPPQGQRQGPLPHPRAPLGRNRARHRLDHRRPLRRHTHPGQARPKVAVRDLRRKRTITLTAGKSYLARAPR